MTVRLLYFDSFENLNFSKLKTFTMHTSCVAFVFQILAGSCCAPVTRYTLWELELNLQIAMLHICCYYYDSTSLS